MAKVALVVMCEHGEEHPGGQGRMLHAMYAAKELRAAGEEVAIWFHGIGVTWLTAFDVRGDKYTEVYGPLFDEVHDLIRGACNFCATVRFGAAESAERLGVPVVGAGREHHTVAALVLDGWQVITF
jgi:hypothetical protein